MENSAALELLNLLRTDALKGGLKVMSEINNRLYIFLSLLAFLCLSPTLVSAQARVGSNSTAITIKIPKLKETVRVDIQTLNEGFDDWNILRDGSLCYPLMISLKNPLDREINLRLEFTESSGYRREGDRPIKYLADFMIPANAEVSR